MAIIEILWSKGIDSIKLSMLFFPMTILFLPQNFTIRKKLAFNKEKLLFKILIMEEIIWKNAIHIITVLRILTSKTHKLQKKTIEGDIFLEYFYTKKRSINKILRIPLFVSDKNLSPFKLILSIHTVCYGQAVKGATRIHSLRVTLFSFCFLSKSSLIIC